MGKVIEEYRSAFERLKRGKAKNVSFSKGDTISLNSVAKEAGKASGSLRKSRGVDYAELCDEINNYVPSKTTQTSRLSSRLERLVEENQKLKEQNNTLKSKYQSLLFMNYQLRRKLLEHKESDRVLSPVVRIIED